MKQLLRITGALIFIAALAVLLAASPLSFARPQTVHSAADLADPKVTTKATILQSDSFGLILELETTPFSIADDGTISVEGLAQSLAEPGAPELPYYSTFVALPPNADVSIETRQRDMVTDAPLDVFPVPQERLWGEETAANQTMPYVSGSFRELTPLRARNSLIYNADALFPATAYTVSKPLYLRDLRLVELRLHPLRYNPVQKSMSQATRLTAEIRFLHPDEPAVTTPSVADVNNSDPWRAQIINYDQAQSWRSFPQAAAEENLIGLPAGHEVFKIEVNQDGIHELAGAELAALGMELPVDPATLQMMQRGRQVAFQFVDTNGNQVFDAVDKLRFYGWAFAGTRQEKLYVSANVFWLWDHGNGAAIPTIDNQAGAGSMVTSFRDSVTRWEELYFSSGWSITWDENEPTTWHTRAMAMEPGKVNTELVDIDLPTPDPAGGDASYVVELTTRLRRPDVGSSTVSFEAQTRLNDSNQLGQRSWVGPKNLNVKSTAAAGSLKQPGQTGYPSNQIELKLSSSSPTPLNLLLTRVTVDYDRQLVAANDYLSFGRQENGPSTFKVSGFSNADSNKVLAWDISDRHLPRQIRLNPSDISGSGDSHTYTIGANHGSGARFVVMTSDNLLSAQSIEKYVPAAIEPPADGAVWLGITHKSLKNAAESLAAYRSAAMSAFVVDMEDVVNQVGYGFNTPETLRAYLRLAISNWTVSPRYVTLFGDATNNPRRLECTGCGSSWDTETPNLIVTDFVFVDRWQGMIPSDYALTLLFGEDLLADVAISRMPANSLAEANAMVQKVITYENQRSGEEPPGWTKNLLFIADNKDNGGDFCSQNKTIEPLVAGEYNQTHLCLEEPTAANIANLRSEMRKEISDNGVSIANYRGHGSTTQWGGFNNEPAILSTDDVDFWENAGRAVVLLSADCLDGYFILNGESALGETFMRLNNRGSVAHWSSAGLGYSSEHSVLLRAFYEGIFNYNQNRIGDAVNFAKTRYYQAGRHPSELYSFVLLGDAVMAAVPKQELRVFMPVAYTP